MEFQPVEGATRIDFTLEANAQDIRDQVAFIILVYRKFNGKVSDIGAFTSSAGIKLWVALQFDSYDPWDSARAHCQGHLDVDGRVNKSYRGALEYADRGFRQTDALLQRLRAAPANQDITTQPASLTAEAAVASRSVPQHRPDMEAQLAKTFSSDTTGAEKTYLALVPAVARSGS